MSKPTLLVTGASGHLGRRVIELLLEANAGTVVAASRAPEKLADFAAQGVIVRHADFDDPTSLTTAFAGVDRLLLISTDALGVPGLRIKQHVNAVKAAEAAGVKHVVYTSLTNAADTPILLAPDHKATEDALAASALGWTVLRNNVYSEMQISALNRAISMGQLFSACGEGKIGYITREDCARAAAAALASDFEGKRTLEVTGPEAVSQYDLAAIASQLSGQTVTYIPLTLEALTQGMVDAGLPRPVADVYASFDAGAAQGKLDVVTNVVEELTGKKPTRLADYIAANRDAVLQGAATA